MSKISQRVTSFKEYHISILSVQDKFHTYTSQVEITNQVCDYVELLKPYYCDICERVFLARSALRYPVNNGYKDDYKAESENNRLLGELVDDIKKSYFDKDEEINVTLLRYMVYHVFDLLVNFSKEEKNKYPSFAGYWEFVWSNIKIDVDIAFSAAKTDEGVTYKINIPYKNKNIDKVIWHRWVKVSINKHMDPIDIKCINTGKDQVVTSMSQHLEVSRLRLINNKIGLFFEVKKETPEQNKSQVTMSIDRGINTFLTYHVEDYDGGVIPVTHCCNKELKKQYYEAIDSEDKQRIFNAKYEILSYAVNDFVKKIEDCKPRIIILENMVGEFENNADKYVRAFPWRDFQKIIRRKAAEAGVHIIMVYDNCTSRDYALGDDIIIRNERNRSKGYCKKTGQKVCCDENAAFNIWGRGVVKILEYYLLTPLQVDEIKRYVKSKGRTIATVNYALAKEVIGYCRTHFGIDFF